MQHSSPWLGFELGGADFGLFGCKVVHGGPKI